MAEKPWRPSNWAEIRQRLGSDRPSFEAGADAMLGALKSEGEYIGEGHEDPELRFNDGKGWHIIFGWRVFIPDGKYK